MSDEKPPINLDDIDFGHTIRGHQKGDRVFERFILQRLLGRGGMGVVWLAKDERLGREVALKFAPEAVRYDDMAVDELKEETLKGLNLAHPGIVKIYDFLLDDDHAAISMEFIDGENLGSLRTRQPNKIFETRQLATWVSQFLEALDYAHRIAKVIHRDLKPANLMVDRESNLRVTDFGIARSISDAMNRATMAVGNSTGTLAYMSPQQADGRKPHVSDDIYAFGSTLYELITGKPPFFSGNIIHQLKEESVQSLTERRLEFGITNAEPIPVEWEQTILACLEKSPENRPSSAQIVRQRLGLAPGGLLVEVSPVPPTGSVPPMAPPTGQGTSAGTAHSTAALPPAFPGAHTSHVGATQTYVRAGVGMTEMSVPTRPIGSGAIRVGPGVSPVPGTTTHASTGTGTDTVLPPRKSHAVIITVVLVILLMGVGVVGAGGWWAYNNLPYFKKNKPDPKVVTNPTITSDPDPTHQTSQPPVVVKNDAKVEPPPSPPVPKHDSSPTPPSPNPTPPTPTPGPPAKVTTIQAAINAAKSGETVTIPSGIYEEQLRLKPGVSLKAEATGKVIVQTDGRVGSALLAENCEGGSIKGFIFQHTGEDISDKVSWPVAMVKSSSLVLEDCTFQAGVADGLLITGACKPQVLRCTFRNNARNGVTIESGVNGSFSACEARKNGENGIEVRHIGTFPVVEGCTLAENGLSGLAVKDGASVNVTAKTICKSNGEAGLVAAGEGSTLVASQMVCEDNEVGIAAEKGAIVKLVENQVLLSKKAGIQLDMIATGSEVSTNDVQKNKRDGILAVGGQGITISIMGNKVKGNAGTGIIVFGQGFKPKVSQNECSTNGEYGILASENVGGSITDNTSRGNHLAGVSNQGGASDLVIQGNIADDGSK
ncbi:MAG: right-handed parallel beta-helix repeat-containing protein [Verrucomicrobium sp.]